MSFLRKLLEQELTDEGHLVTTTGDADSVNELLESLSPDLVLLDLYMKGIDRWDVLNNIKQKDPRLPVFIFTAHDSYSQDPRLSQSDGYMIKSIYFDELKKKVSEVLKVN